MKGDGDTASLIMEIDRERIKVARNWLEEKFYPAILDNFGLEDYRLIDDTPRVDDESVRTTDEPVQLAITINGIKDTISLYPRNAAQLVRELRNVYGWKNSPPGVSYGMSPLSKATRQRCNDPQHGDEPHFCGVYVPPRVESPPGWSEQTTHPPPIHCGHGRPWRVAENGHSTHLSRTVGKAIDGTPTNRDRWASCAWIPPVVGSVFSYTRKDQGR